MKFIKNSAINIIYDHNRKPMIELLLRIAEGHDKDNNPIMVGEQRLFFSEAGLREFAKHLIDHADTLAALPQFIEAVT